MTDERRGPVAERRTLALRGPGAGGFTPATSLAASNPCLNCGTNIQLEYCPECGQREIDVDPTLRESLWEMGAEFMQRDRKFLLTMRTLLTRPGALTCEYLEGKRVRFISPLRLYLGCSALFFFLASFTPSRAMTFTSGSHTVSASVSRGAFVLLPVFAALFAMAFRDRRRRYPQHFAFALHVHAVLYLALTALLIERIATLPLVQVAGRLVVGAGMAFYLVAATRRVYGGARSSVLLRLSGVAIAYLAAFIAMSLMLFAVGALLP